MSRFNVSNAGWSEAALQYLAEHWPTQTRTQLGQVLGCSPSAVIGKAHRMHLPAKESPIKRRAQPELSDETRAWAKSQGLPDTHGSKFFSLRGVKVSKGASARRAPAAPAAKRKRKLVVKPPKLRSIIMPAPVGLPPPQLPALALERGTPGVWQPPIGLPWTVIIALAAQAHYDLHGVETLPLFNRSRVARGFAPLAIARAKEKASR